MIWCFSLFRFLAYFRIRASVVGLCEKECGLRARYVGSGDLLGKKF